MKFKFIDDWKGGVILFIGEYNYSIDTKGRLNFPVKLRDELGERFIVVKGLGDSCLFVYSLEEWALFSQKIKSMPISKAKNLQRFLFASAAECEPDKQGRIIIPLNLREYATLSKDVVIIGTANHCEIWDKDKWIDFCSQVDLDEIVSVTDEISF